MPEPAAPRPLAVNAARYHTHFTGAFPDLAFAESFGGASRDVVAGGLVVAEAHDGDDVERGSFAARSLPRSRRCRPFVLPLLAGLGGHAAEFGEGCFVADPVGVVANGDEELAGEPLPESSPVADVGGPASPFRMPSLAHPRRA